MADISFVSVGTPQSSTGAITVPWGVHQSGDIGIMLIDTLGSDGDASLATANGFTQITGSPVTGTNKLSIWWARADSSSMSSPITNDSGDHQFGQIAVFRNCVATGTPIGANYTTKNATSATMLFDGITTTRSKSMILNCVGISVSSATPQLSSWTNGEMVSMTEAIDYAAIPGENGGIGLAYGIKTTVGAISQTQVTCSTSRNYCTMQIELLAPLSGGGLMLFSS